MYCDVATLLFVVTAFKVEGVNSTSVKLTLNQFCRQNVTYTAQVFFGVRQGSDDECVPQQIIAADVMPGESVILTVDTSTLMLNPGQEYCSTKATLIGESGKVIYVPHSYIIVWD